MNDDRGIYVWSAGRSTGMPSSLSNESALNATFARDDDCRGACLGLYVDWAPRAGDLGGEFVSKILEEGLRCGDDVIASEATFALPLGSESDVNVTEDAPRSVCEFGVPGLEIQMPSTSTPLWIARTPKGISGRFRAGIPTFPISVILNFFSSSSSSCFRTDRFIHQSLPSPAKKTRTIEQARTCVPLIRGQYVERDNSAYKGHLLP